MAEAALHPDIANIEEWPEGKRTAYNALLRGMTEANQTSHPDYNQPPYVRDNGKRWVNPQGKEITIWEPDEELIAETMSRVSECQTKNAAYMFADAISAAAESGGGNGVDYSDVVRKSGDAMIGMLKAINGFEAGQQNQKIFDVRKIDTGNVAHVYGALKVDGLAELSDGISFNNHKTVYTEGANLIFDYQNTIVKQQLSVEDAFIVGDITANGLGLFCGEYEYYHGGNSNNAGVDWTMRDGEARGNLSVHGEASIGGSLSALGGFAFGYGNNRIFYSSESNIALDADMVIGEACTISLGSSPIIWGRNGNKSTVSFSAPGKILNLGDAATVKGEQILTNHISLQSDLFDVTHNLKLIGRDGSGNFPNGLSVGLLGKGQIANTYSDGDEFGMTFTGLLALGEGHHIALQADNDALTVTLPNLRMVGDIRQYDGFKLNLSMSESNSLWHGVGEDVSTHLSTEGEFFVFDNPIESVSFSINSSNCKTRLQENALFLQDESYIEGVEGGLYLNGNSAFGGNVSSRRFSSGLAGSGWAISKSERNGAYHATFDELTVRRKMRVYELEVQKQSVTNGSLWVSDSCAGDLVEEVS